VRVALLPEGKDVDEVLLEEGVERLDGIVASAKDLFDFKHEELAKTLDLSTARGKAMAAERIGDSVRRVRHVIERDLLFRRVAERLGVPESLVRVQAGKSDDADRARRRRPTGGGGAAAPGAVHPAEHPADDPADRIRAGDVLLEHECLVAGCVARPEMLPAIRAALPVEEVGDPGLALVYRTVLETADERQTPTLAGLCRALSADSEAARALAGLPDDLDWEDRIPWFLRLRASRRQAADRKRAVVQLLAGTDVSPQDGPPGEPLGTR
jgi:DNA primase